MPSYDKSLHEVQGMLRIPHYNDNAEIPFVDIRIIQKCFSHNIIIAKVKHSVFSKSGWLNNPSDIIQKLLGKKMVVRLNHLKQPEDAIYHAAIISSVSFENNEGNEGDVMLNGFSSSVLFDRGKTLEAFHNRSWTDLLSRAKEDIPIDNIHINVNPVNGEEPSSFLLQFNEDTFAFLCRVAAVHGEWLYHDGQSICLGRPDYAKKPLTLTYDKDLPSMTLTTQHIPHKISQFSYNEVTNSFETSQGYKPELTEFAAAAWSSSEKNVSKNIKETNQYTSFPAYTLGEVQKSVQTSLNSKAATGATISGTALTCHANIGKSIIVKIPDSYKSAQKELGSFVITQTEQYISQRGEYKCEFLAMANISKSIPMYDIVLPQAQTLIGRVCDTADPKGLGRVLVELQGIRNWAVGFGVWLRVMSPNAGNTANGEKNRGMVFIPEKNDQVIVDFLNGDTSQPFVMGSLYHSANGQGGGQDNNIKSITTKSGLTIRFEDNKGKEKIIISDTFSNEVTLSAGEKMFSLVSLGKIVLSAEEIELTAKSIKTESEEYKSNANKYEIITDSEINFFSNKVTIKASEINQNQGSGSAPNVKRLGISLLSSEGATKIKHENAIAEEQKKREDEKEKKEKQPKIIKAYFVDMNGEEINSANYDDAVKVVVETKNMIGETIKITLKEGNRQELFDSDKKIIGPFTISANKQEFDLTLEKEQDNA